MSRTYEIMYLIDNNAVRAGWKEAKSAVAALVEKHGGKVLSSRRWEERLLAYPIRRRRRGTYLLAYAEMEPSQVGGLRRELDLADSVLRYLILSVESVPPQELELTAAESSADFVVPMPPPDDVFDSADQDGDEEEDSDEDSGDGESEESEAPAGELAEEEV